MGALVASVGLAEAAVRWLKPQAGTFTGHGMYVADPDLDYRLRPKHRWDDVSINEHGMRDGARALAKAEGRRRVLVLGDSFAFGSQIDVDDGFARVLDRGLGDGVEVINSGTPGYSTVQQRTWLEKFGLAWEPDVVLVAFFVGNDVWENLGTRRVRVIDGEIVPIDAETPSWLRRQAMRLHLVRLLRSVVSGSGVQAGGAPDRRRWYYEIEHRRMNVCRLPAAADPDLEPGWAAARQELGRIKDLVAPRPVVVLAIPDEFQVEGDLRRAVAAEFDLDLEDGSYDFDLPQRRLAEMCDDLGLPLVDPLADLRQRTLAGERLYLDFDSHWNVAGNRVAGELLARQSALAALR